MNGEIERFASDLAERRGASPHTVTNYRLDLEHFVAWIGNHGVGCWTDVDRTLLRSWAAWMRSEGYAPASVARNLSALRTFFRFMTRVGALDRNPLMLVPAPKARQSLPNVMSLEEIERLLEAPDPATPLGARDRCLFEVLYATGLRVSELLQMTLESIDWPQRTVRVLGKGKKERIVLLGDLAIDALERYVHWARPQLSRYPAADALYLSHLGRPLSVRGFHLVLQNHLATAGIRRHVTPHTIRHTFATHMLEGGADLRIVQELLGHASVSTTQVYTHVSEGYLRDVYSRAHKGA